MIYIYAMNYTLHQLAVFIKVVQLKNISKASEELFLTQPAVSIQLKNFQEQFEVPLIELIGKTLRVTDFGMDIYRIAERIMNDVETINYKTQAYKGLLSGKLKLAIVSTGKYVMPYLIADFIREHQAVDLVMDVTNKSKVIESLAAGEVDFALVSVLPETIKVEEELIMDNELQLIANSKFKKSKKMLTKEDIKHLPLIYREIGSATRTLMEQYVSKRRINPGKKMELTSNEAVKQAVKAGLGVSIMPIIGIRSDLKNGELIILKTEGLPIKTKWRLIWLKSRQLSPVAESFVTYLKQHKSRILQTHFKDIGR